MAPFYVYELIDPRNGKPFYVGKGKGQRYRAHETQARKGKRGPKCNTIRDIWESGHTVVHRMVSRHDLEADAYIAEDRHIDSIGLQNLTNQIPGGFWSIREPKPFKWTAALAAKVMPKLCVAFARVFRPGNDGRMYIYNKYDITEPVMSLIRKMMVDLGGPEKFYELWYVHEARPNENNRLGTQLGSPA